MSVEPSDEEYLIEAEGLIMGLERRIEELEAPKKLVIYIEKGLGGSLYWTNSNVKFDEILFVESTALSVSEDAEMYEECHGLSPYSADQYVLSLEKVEERIAQARKRCEFAAQWREENL